MLAASWQRTLSELRTLSECFAEVAGRLADHKLWMHRADPAPFRGAHG